MTFQKDGILRRHRPEIKIKKGMLFETIYDILGDKFHHRSKKESPMKPVRNRSMECAKLVAAVFVVFLHVPFPGEIGGLVCCLSRFAVPLFFAISGYFSYQTQPKKLVKRLCHILTLELLGILLQILWRCFQAVLLGGSIPDVLLSLIPTGDMMKRWMLFHVDPFSGHLWYLSAMVSCYGVLWLYTLLWYKKRSSYGPLYAVSGILLVLFFCLSEFSGGLGIHVDYILYRNAWLFGLPMFSMGLFLRNYQPRLSAAGGKLLLLMLAGTALSIVEWRHLGGWEMYGGTVLFTGALLLLLAKHPLAGAPKVLGIFGSLSTPVYLIHLIFLEWYNQFYQWPLSQRLGAAEGWLRPFIVLAMSLITAACIVCLQSVFRHFRKGVKTP